MKNNWKFFTLSCSLRFVYEEKLTTVFQKSFFFSWKPALISLNSPNMAVYLSQSLKTCVKSSGKMPVCNRREDASQGVVVEFVDRDDVQMSGEAASDVITSSAWRTHC